MQIEELRSYFKMLQFTTVVSFMMILIISKHSLSINSTIIHALLCKICWSSQYIN